MSKVCPTKGGKKQMNIVCPVDVSKQPGKSLPDIQIADYAVNYLKNYTRDKPFFMAVGFHKPHIPLKFPKEFLGFYIKISFLFLLLLNFSNSFLLIIC